MQHPVRLFAAGLLKRRWALMSCAAFTIITAYTAAANGRDVWLVLGTALLAGAFFGVAAYRAWQEEHDKLMAEVAKYKGPDISGEAFNFRGYRSQQDDQRRSASHEVAFEVFLCNHSPVSTTLKRIELDGTRLTPAVLFDFPVIGAETALPVDLEMPRGIGKQITLRVAARIGGMGMRQMPPIALGNLAIYIVDATDQKHPVRTRAGECLIFGER